MDDTRIDYDKNNASTTGITVGEWQGHRGLKNKSGDVNNQPTHGGYPETK